jgi:hypothetical protein
MPFIDSAHSDAEVGAEQVRGCGGHYGSPTTGSDKPSFLHNVTVDQI